LPQVTIKQLLEAGVHFGHQTQRWNPKMKKYIFGERNGIYIINLEITLSCLDRAMTFLRNAAAEGKEILLVGTKRQAQEPIKEVAERVGMPYVDQRWLGGMLTNFETVRKSVARLDQIDQMEKDGSFSFVTKKEVGMLKKEREKLMKNLTGVRKMRRLPSALFVIDSKKEEIAIKEAVKLGIPIAAVLDTNCDPDKVDFPIPGNDDAIRAVKLFCEVAAQAIKEGREQYLQQSAPAPVAAAESVASEDGETPVAVNAESYSFAAAMEGEDRPEEKLAERFAPPEEVVDKEKIVSKVKKTPRKDKAK
jgi:small subunit ribosomal protein S2